MGATAVGIDLAGGRIAIGSAAGVRLASVTTDACVITPSGDFPEPIAVEAPEGISTLVFTGGRLLVAGPGGGAIIELADASSIACPQLKSEASVLPAGLVMTVNTGEAGYDLVDIDGPTCRREAKNQFPALALAQVATTSDGLFVAGRLSSVEGSSGVARLGDGKSLWEAGAGGLFASLDGLGVCGDDLCVLDASNAQLVRLSQTWASPTPPPTWNRAPAGWSRPPDPVCHSSASTSLADRCPTSPERNPP